MNQSRFPRTHFWLEAFLSFKHTNFFGHASCFLFFPTFSLLLSTLVKKSSIISCLHNKAFLILATFITKLHRSLTSICVDCIVIIKLNFGLSTWCGPYCPLQLLLSNMVGVLSQFTQSPFQWTNQPCKKNSWVITIGRRMCINILIKFEKCFIVLNNHKFTDAYFPTIGLPCTKHKGDFIIKNQRRHVSLWAFRPLAPKLKHVQEWTTKYVIIYEVFPFLSY